MLYAKSEKENIKQFKETIREHTDKLLENLRLFKLLYERQVNKLIQMDIERFWELLRIVCEYHDYGKANIAFQNKRLKEMNMPEVGIWTYDEVPHAYISPAFLDYKLFNSEEEEILVYQVIAYHHERKTEPSITDIQRVVDHINSNINYYNKELNTNFTKLKTLYVNDIMFKKRIKEGDSIYNDYVLMKGLLHRLDHSSSAHIAIEDQTLKSTSEITNDFFKVKNLIKNDAQLFCESNSDENIVLIASTGSGKTESALLYANNDKTFITLPLRVSINALYDRAIKMNLDSVSLMHSSSKEHLQSKGVVDFMNIVNESRLLSRKLNFSTIDQIFKFPFKYRGYEKIYATLAYSKVVIDEIQAYSPQMTAVILKGLEMIHEIGGKFMIMTATLPSIYKDYLIAKGIGFKEYEYILNKNRHKISVNSRMLMDDVDTIINKAQQDKKVLVICNTVNMSKAMYDDIKKKYSSVKLLHSGFINKDRADKEAAIESNAGGEIWITTQIVEASLDIDFDMLYTEMSTLDSLFQRFGRCYRKRDYLGDDANVNIYISKVSGRGTIYDEDIMSKSISYIYRYNNSFIAEKDKSEMVERLYSKQELAGTDFLNKFNNACKQLDNIIEYDTSSREAQKLFRDISTYTVIPEDIYLKNQNLFIDYANEKNYEKKSIILLEINKLTLSVAYYKIKDENKLSNSEIDYIKVINCKYDSDYGLAL